MSESKTRMMRASKLISNPLHTSQVIGQNFNKYSLSAKQAQNRRKLGEDGAKLIRDRKDEFIDLDDL